MRERGGLVTVRKLSPQDEQTIRELLGDRQEVIVEIGNRPVLVRLMSLENYDLDRDLENPRVAEIVARGYADAASGRLIDHQEVVQRIRDKR